MDKINFRKLGLIFCSMGLALVLGKVILAWVEPGSMPPITGQKGPVSEAATEQIKAGKLGLGEGSVYKIGVMAGTLKLDNNDNQTKAVLGQDGHVGIGTMVPGALLDVAGKIKMQEACLGSDCIKAWPKGKCNAGEVISEIDENGIKCVPI